MNPSSPSDRDQSANLPSADAGPTTPPLSNRAESLDVQTADHHAAVEPPAARSSSEPSDWPKRIGRYRVEGSLGKGSFGVVFLAQDEQLKRQVAIKVPHRSLIARPEDAEVYLTEARTVASLDHPHIVPVFDVGSNQDFPCFIVSKYIAGNNLAQKISNGRPAVQEATELVATIAEALHYAHLRGLVHLDIKPGNILLDASGKAFVVDFGMALKAEDVAKGPNFGGTPAYMSPEQARGEGHRLDGRSDIFSLGIVFYELLTGRRPFQGESLEDVKEQITVSEPRPPRQCDDAIPKELERICLKALSKSLSERYTTAKDMAEALRHFLDKKSAGPAPLATETTRKRRTSRVAGPKTPVPPKQEAAELSNPYEFAATATNQTFKGRQEELGELLDSIRTGTHTAIFGLQRMGKTSLIEEGLKDALAQHSRLAKEVLLVRIDLQGLGGDQVKYRDLVHAIIEAITAQLAAVGIGRPLQDLKALTHELFSAGRGQRGDRSQFFSMFAKLLRGFASAAHRRIVLFIDEFSEVRKVIERNKVALQHNPLRSANLLPHDMYIDVPFIHHLGSLLKDRELRSKFSLILVVRPFMAEYDDREELQILKLMKPIMLYYLDETAAKALITEPLQDKVTFEAGAVDCLYHLTAGHPYLLQFLLKMLVDKVNREARREIRLDDVRWIEKRMVCEGPAYDAQFEVLISDYSVAEIMHPKEGLLGKGTLALIAKLGQEQPDRWVVQEQIAERLLAHKVPVEKTTSLLSQLTRTKILEEKNQEGRLCYRMAVPLLHNRFVQQNLYLKSFR
jgi:serine/threonine protein kinase